MCAEKVTDQNANVCTKSTGAEVCAAIGEYKGKFLPYKKVGGKAVGGRIFSLRRDVQSSGRTTSHACLPGSVLEAGRQCRALHQHGEGEVNASP